jgi:hypothetical protein
LVTSTGAEGVVTHSCSVAELLDRWLAHKQGTLTPATYEEYRRTVARSRAGQAMADEEGPRRARRPRGHRRPGDGARPARRSVPGAAGGHRR